MDNACRFKYISIFIVTDSTISNCFHHFAFIAAICFLVAFNESKNLYYDKMENNIDWLINIMRDE